MKKNINVNISGLLFNIDEDAFAALQNYLDRLKHYFGSDESATEIINDIESRIAEMMQEKLSERKSVITIEDVNEIIKIMGEPGEIEDESEFESKNQATPPPFEAKSTNNQSSSSNKRKLYRDPDDKIIGGVSSGLGYYFGIAPVWIRLAFIALTFFGMSILVYIILWIVIPEARTTAQKLEMRGEPVNIDNIEKSIREELNNLGDKLNDIKDKHFKKKSEGPNLFERIAGAIISIIGFAFRALLIFIGIILAIVALILILALIPTFFAGGSLFIHSFPGFSSISIFNLSNLLFSGAYGSKMAYVGLMLFIFVPLIAIVYHGIRLIFGYKGRSGMGITFFIIWITGVVLLILAGTQLANDMNSKASISTEIQLKNQLQSDTLYVKIDKDYYSNLQLEDYLGDHVDLQFYANKDYFYIPPRLNIYDLDSNEDASIEIVKKSRAHNYIRAKQMAEHIYFPYQFRNDTLIIAPLIQVPKADKWRNPKVNINLNIPEGIFVKYVNIKTDDPVLNDIQEDFNYRLEIDDKSILVVGNDSNQLYIKTDDAEIKIDSDKLKIKTK